MEVQLKKDIFQIGQLYSISDCFTFVPNTININNLIISKLGYYNDKANNILINNDEKTFMLTHLITENVSQAITFKYNEESCTYEFKNNNIQKPEINDPVALSSNQIYFPIAITGQDCIKISGYINPDIYFLVNGNTDYNTDEYNFYYYEDSYIQNEEITSDSLLWECQENNIIYSKRKDETDETEYNFVNYNDNYNSAYNYFIKNEYTLISDIKSISEDKKVYKKAKDKMIITFVTNQTLGQNKYFDYKYIKEWVSDTSIPYKNRFKKEDNPFNFGKGNCIIQLKAKDNTNIKKDQFSKSLPQAMFINNIIELDNSDFVYNKLADDEAKTTFNIYSYLNSLNETTDSAITLENIIKLCETEEIYNYDNYMLYIQDYSRYVIKKDESDKHKCTLHQLDILQNSKLYSKTEAETILLNRASDYYTLFNNNFSYIVNNYITFPSFNDIIYYKTKSQVQIDEETKKPFANSIPYWKKEEKDDSTTKYITISFTLYNDKSIFTWPGWEQATWEQIYQLCNKVKNDENEKFSNYPDIQCGNTKTIELNNSIIEVNENPNEGDKVYSAENTNSETTTQYKLITYDSSIYEEINTFIYTKNPTAMLYKIDEDNGCLFFVLYKAPISQVNFPLSSPAGCINNTTVNSDFLSYLIKPSVALYTYDYDNNKKITTWHTCDSWYIDTLEIIGQRIVQENTTVSDRLIETGIRYNDIEFKSSEYLVQLYKDGKTLPFLMFTKNPYYYNTSNDIIFTRHSSQYSSLIGDYDFAPLCCTTGQVHITNANIKTNYFTAFAI